MSTKKDKFTQKDKNYMRLALNLASSRIGLTGDNPSVGCLIVKKDKIISIGKTGYDGRPHAEYSAIKNSLEKLNGSKMYVTLEPCNHYGKTPPCTNSIIKSGIKEIIYGMDDIDKRSAKKSYVLFKKKKIQVIRNILKNDAPYLIGQEKSSLVREFNTLKPILQTQEGFKDKYQNQARDLLEDFLEEEKNRGLISKVQGTAIEFLRNYLKMETRFSKIFHGGYDPQNSVF